MRNTKKLTCVSFIVIALCLTLTALATVDDYSMYTEPEWLEDGSAFGWFCDKKDAYYKKACIREFPESPGIVPSGEDAFKERFTWRTHLDVKSAGPENSRGICTVYLKPKEPAGLPEVKAVTFASMKMWDVADDRCVVMFSPDGKHIGIAAGWTGVDDEDFKAEVYTPEQLESRYWNALGLQIYEEDHDKAVKYFQHALALDSEYYWPRYNMACTYALAGDTKNALIQLAAAISMDPKKLRKRAKKDKDLKSLKDEEDFKLILKKDDGCKEVQERLGKPGPDELPPTVKGKEEEKEEEEDAAKKAEAEEKKEGEEKEKAAETEKKSACGCILVY